MKPQLTLPLLKKCARDFARNLGSREIADLYGITDGKAVGTHVEHRFFKYLTVRFAYQVGSSASGIDFPDLAVDLKVTSIRQPQSSCPYKSASQKVYGLGYHLLVFVYEKHDNSRKKTARLNFRHGLFIDLKHTADYQTTRGLLEILDREGNQDDVAAYLEERNLPLDDIGRTRLAQQILSERPAQGYLTVSNALQWRLQYGRAVEIAAQGGNEGIENLLAT
jgi:restriction system protein